MTRRLTLRSDRVVDLALILGAVTMLLPILFVMTRPVFVPRYPRVGKIELRVVPVARAVAEARR